MPETELVENLASDDCLKKQNAFNRIKKMSVSEITDFARPLFMTSENVKLKYALIEAIEEVKNDQIAQLLLEASFAKVNTRYAGSFICALKWQNCANFYLPLVKIALYGTYEAQNYALEILQNSKFNVSVIDIDIARLLLRGYRDGDNKCEEWNLLLNELECVAIQKQLDRIDWK